MTLTLEATYENGQLKFKEPVLLAEGTPVRVTITPISADDDPLAGFIGSLHTGRTDGAEHHDEYLTKKRRP
jgi:predicted DNA-binding antitoxin AbrB/MazE fold protein